METASQGYPRSYSPSPTRKRYEYYTPAERESKGEFGEDYSFNHYESPTKRMKEKNVESPYGFSPFVSPVPEKYESPVKKYNESSSPRKMYPRNEDDDHYSSYSRKFKPKRLMSYMQYTAEREENLYTST